MKFIILIKATPDSEAGVMPGEGMIEKMSAFHQELAKAGVLVDATGLRPTTAGWRIRHDRDGSRLIEGPFAETNLVSGYTIIDVASRDEALAWSRRYPNPAPDGKPGEIEVRPYLTLEDFDDSRAVQRFRDMCTAQLNTSGNRETAHV